MWNDTDKRFDVGAGAGITVEADAVSWNGLVTRVDGGSDLAARRRAHLVSNAAVSFFAVDSAGNAETQVAAFITPGDHGDIESSGTGGSVWTIKDGVVGLAKLEDIDANSFLANPTGSAAAPVAHPFSTLAGNGLGYSSGALAVGAGDGIDVSSDAVAVDVSDFAGSGLEDDGSNNLRIAAAAAGAGLTGGGGSALAVGQGSGIQVNADSVQLAPIADDTLLANVSGGSAAPSAKSFSSLAGSGMSYSASAHALNVSLPWALLGRFSVSYTFSTTTTNSDPGNGNLRLDNSTQSSATTIRADEQSAQGDNVITTLEQLAFYQATGAKAVIVLVSTSDVSRFLMFEATGATDVGGYWNIAGSVVHSSSASPFSNGESIRMTVTPLAPGSDRLSTAVEISTGSSAADIGVGPGFGRLTFGQGAGFIDSPSNERICQIERDITGDTTCTYRWAFVSINSGFVLANPEGSSHAPYPCSLDTLFDQVFGSSANTAIANVAGTWAGVSLGTNQLLGRVGTGNVGGVSVGAVVNSHVSSVVGYLRNNGDGTLSSFGAASQAQQEVGTSTTAPVTPSVQHFHKSAAKAWGLFDSSGNILNSYNVSGVSNDSTGVFTVTLSQAQNTSDFCVAATAWTSTTTNGRFVRIDTNTGRSSSTFQCSTQSDNGTAASGAAVSFAVFSPGEA